MRLDCHQHFWKYDAAEYPWISKARHSSATGSPTISARSRKHSASTARSRCKRGRPWRNPIGSSLSLTRPPRIKGVVGWVDLRSEKVAEQLTPLAAHPKFVGVRHVVQSEPDDRFLVREEFVRGIGILGTFKLVYELLVMPHQLPAAIELVQHFPAQTFVLDHIAKPPIKTREISPWREQILELAKSPHVSCKVSGLVTEADLHAWKADDFRPYLDVVFAAFGPERLMWGSDWPVCLLAASYPQVATLVEDYTASMPPADHAKIFGGNAERIYLRRFSGQNCAS